MIILFLRNSFLIGIYVCIYIPIIILIVHSFSTSNFSNHSQWTTEWYSILLNDDSLLKATGNSLTIAIISATFTTFMGLLSALALFRYNFKGKIFINSMLFIVMISPDIVIAISLLLNFMLLGISLGFWSLLLSHITFCLPFVVITIYAKLKDLDITILEAAQDLGASELMILWQIILPLTLSPIISSWLLSIAISIDDVVISYFVTGPTYEILPLKIYSMIKIGMSPEINALTTILLFISLILGLLILWIFKKNN
ncbi:Inner membrane ABC transporter permease protein YdcV [Candidatus Arsenophonus lipoptenae]|uniref:Spermidine/putrescine transport system permease protein PotC n=1 Tax=Candidatus Arsenophonus lipoptenae TaxID=634113 RepID=A0A120HPX0_9GAMM|nr:spermidine/putrescine ABC transporter permease PotC [Candidatus Arsenophonus lipoptenae]AMA65054.1 Inner membrane ABC transporter permease protein YdcV [Candidatus Arsenophonus lipoptenae]